VSINGLATFYPLSVPSGVIVYPDLIAFLEVTYAFFKVHCIPEFTFSIHRFYGVLWG
jgi:hypothetical protein